MHTAQSYVSFDINLPFSKCEEDVLIAISALGVLDPFVRSPTVSLNRPESFSTYSQTGDGHNTPCCFLIWV